MLKKAEELKEENSKLQQEIIDLQNKLDDTESLDSLKSAVNFIDEKYVESSLAAKVVSKNDGNWYTSFVVAAGSDDGVKKDSLVMNRDGLVGIVYEVSDHYCKVISLLDTKSSVSLN
jgi:Cell shape-determining protein